MNATSVKTSFEGHNGAKLAARLDIPAGQIRAYALFAHCFTCSKDLNAVKQIAVQLARSGIALLRFDFTGLGSSKGEFASTNFSSNVQDLVLAANYLKANHAAPEILIGHSLGGAAVLAAAPLLDDVKAVVTIGAPSDVEHVLHNFGSDLTQIETDGRAEVDLAGRKFTIEKQFVDDVRSAKVLDGVANMKKALMVMHSPIDATVGVENAGAIFAAAKHPKSFVSLDNADHLLMQAKDAAFAAKVISSWVERYISGESKDVDNEIEGIRVSETTEGKFQQIVQSGKHRMLADEPESYGGLNSGPSPYDFMSIALGACTGMTLRMYFDRKKVDIGRISVDVSHGKVHLEDCVECTHENKGRAGRIDRFERAISIEGGVPEELQEKVLEIADKCPVHRTLETDSVVATVLKP